MGESVAAHHQSHVGNPLPERFEEHQIPGAQFGSSHFEPDPELILGDPRQAHPRHPEVHLLNKSRAIRASPVVATAMIRGANPSIRLGLPGG
jgi:hypothetical protein